MFDKTWQSRSFHIAISAFKKLGAQFYEFQLKLIVFRKKNPISYYIDKFLCYRRKNTSNHISVNHRVFFFVLRPVRIIILLEFVWGSMGLYSQVI